MAITEDAFVPMPDGVRLAATLYLPAGEGPWPSLLEALPYRKDDLTAGYAEEYHRFADEFGYAVCRLDVRGTGSSDGVAEDEYTAQEHDDIVAVIAWLAAREWSTGAVASSTSPPTWTPATRSPRCPGSPARIGASDGRSASSATCRGR
jgi:predicted acyl esterase